MAGIYIHIPYCKKACNYCDFHFSTSFRTADKMVDAICKEIALKKDRLENQTIGSIYLGGGTPSVLPTSAFEKIFDTINRNFSVSADAEITVEANPDDLNASKIKELRQLPINRFSIGIQSFFDDDLRWMNRAHTAEEGIACIKRSQDAGFENLSVDLIYGFPLLTDKKLSENIETIIELRTPHVSGYSLTVESKTALAHAIRKGKDQNVSDVQSAEQFLLLNKKLEEAGFEAYEISNFAQPGKYAVHNTNYWKGIAYLGIGPSAHGYDGQTRYFNIANNQKYINSLAQNQLPETIEELSISDRYNEYMMTSLRTQWGVDLQKVERDFGKSYKENLINEIPKLIDEEKLTLTEDIIKLTKQGKLFADGIAASLFV